MNKRFIPVAGYTLILIIIWFVTPYLYRTEYHQSSRRYTDYLNATKRMRAELIYNEDSINIVSSFKTYQDFKDRQVTFKIVFFSKDLIDDKQRIINDIKAIYNEYGLSARYGRVLR